MGQYDMTDTYNKEPMGLTAMVADTMQKARADTELHMRQKSAVVDFFKNPDNQKRYQKRYRAVLEAPLADRHPHYANRKTTDNG